MRIIVYRRSSALEIANDGVSFRTYQSITSLYFFASLEKVKQKDLRQRSDTVALGTSLTRHAHDAENNKTRLPPVGSNNYCFLRLLSATGTPT